MAIMERVAVEPVADAPPRGRRFSPHWSTSRVPWIVTGALGVAAVMTGLLLWSLHTMAATQDEQRGSITSYCLDMGGTAASCGDLTLQSGDSSAADASIDSSDSISS